ncbi:MAG: hypothetical protein ACLGHL_05000 [Actinomycetota bacterium]
MRRLAIVLFVVALLAPLGGARAQTEPDPQPAGTVDLAVALEGPSDLLAGDQGLFVVTARNEGQEVATGSSLSISLPVGLEGLSVTASDPAIECRWEDYAWAGPEGSADTSSGAGGGYASCDLGEMSVAEAVRVDVPVERTRAYEMYLSAWVGSFEGDTNYDDNYTDRSLAADRSRPADLSVEASATEVGVGDTFPLRVGVRNSGPSAADAIDATVWIPEGAEVVTLPEGCVDDATPRNSHPEIWMPSTVTCRVDRIGVGERSVVELLLRRTSGWELYGSAWVGSANLDEDPSDDYASWDMPSDPSVTSDLSITANGPAATPLVGDTFSISYSIANQGPTAAGDVFFTDQLAYGLEFVSAPEGCTFTDYGYKEPQPVEGGASDPVYYGGGMLVCDVGLLEVGDARTLDVSFTRSSAYPLYDYAYVSTSNYDPRWENNYAETFFDADRTNSADVAVELEAPADAEVGETFTFTLSVTNLGSQPASGVMLHDYIPEGLEFRGVDRSDVCTFEGGAEGGDAAPSPEVTTPTYTAPRELVCSMGSLQPGEVSSVQVEVMRTLDWWIWNGAWAYSETFDPDYNNDYAYFELPGEDPYVDCSGAEGSKGSDVISNDTCPVESGAGDDAVGLEVGASDSDRTVRTGRGADVVNLDVRTGSSSRRLIEVRAGRGSDAINVTVGAVAGNARIVLYGGAGADSVTLDVAPGAIDVTFIVRLGRGDDALRYIRYGDRSSPPLKVWGGPDSDRIYSGQGADVLSGGDGRDALDAGAGDDSVSGGRGRDVCIDGPGTDHIRC